LGLHLNQISFLSIVVEKKGGLQMERGRARSRGRGDKTIGSREDKE
jgi:hypothetical protein